MVSTYLSLLVIFLALVLGWNRFVPAAAGKAHWRGVLVDFARSLFPILLVVLALRSCVAEPFRIPSGSMIPTLEIGDYILVNKFRYGFSEPLLGSVWKYNSSPERGDIVVFFPPNERRYFIKRLVGLPGDHIEYSGRRLKINGKPVPLSPVRRLSSGELLLDEQLDSAPHQVLHTPQRRSMPFIGRVKPDHYFMMGDNRDNSQDSRYWGQVPRRNLVGPAFYRWMRWDGLGSWPEFDDVGGIR